jgi:voltage-gated potassium channel
MPRSLRARTHALLTPDEGGRAGAAVDTFIMGLIALNVLAVIVETVPGFAAAYGDAFAAFELLSVAVFTAEYAARIWSAPEDPAYAAPLRGRVRFASRPLIVVDLLAILPFYLASVLPLDLRIVRAFRLIRFFRLLKLARYSQSMRAFARVLREKKEDLVVAGAANLLLLTVASSLMYFAENEAQPEAFSSIPEAMWWGIITLTTVGYGDVTPVTALGKVLGAVVAILGIGLFALPASILASGFIEEATREELRRCPHCGEELDG